MSKKEGAKIAQTAATAAHVAHIEYLTAKGDAEQRAQASTNAAFQSATEALHAIDPKATPKAIGAALLKACKQANEQANNTREKIPASRISRALKAVKIEGWTEDGKGCAVRVHAPKGAKTAADLVADLAAQAAKIVDAVNDPKELQTLQDAVAAIIAAKIAALEAIAE